MKFVVVINLDRFDFRFNFVLDAFDVLSINFDAAVARAFRQVQLIGQLVARSS